MFSQRCIPTIEFGLNFQRENPCQAASQCGVHTKKPTVTNEKKNLHKFIETQTIGYSVSMSTGFMI